MQLESLRPLLFSVRTFAAALLALFVAYSIDLGRPSWAVVTVYIVSQPLAGMSRSKGMYRILGTLVGAVFSVVAVPNLVQAPELLCLVLALWLGGCLYLAIIDGTPRAYAFMLAGYTASIISFPSVDNPTAIFDNALARAEEISLGIVCVVFVSYFPMAERVGPLLQRQLGRWIADARHWAVDVLREKPSAHERLRLINDVVQLNALRIHARYDTPELRQAESAITELQHGMQHYFSLLTAMEDDIAQLRVLHSKQLDVLQDVLAQLAAWVMTDQDDASMVEHAKMLQQAMVRLRPSADEIRADQGKLMVYGLLLHFQEFVEVRVRCRRLVADIQARRQVARTRREVVRHRDHRLALRSGMAATLCILILSAFWIQSGWPDGASACVLAAIICSLFATLDDPVPVMFKFMILVNVGVVLGLAYQFAILPHLDGFIPFAVALALFFIPCGILHAKPKYFAPIMATVIGFTTQIGLQSRFSVDLAATLNIAVAQSFGIMVAAITLKLLRSLDTPQMLCRLLRANRADLMRVAAQVSSISRDDFIGRMADRIAAVVVRAAEMGAPALGSVREALLDMQTGLAIFQLRQAGERLPHSHRAIQRLLYMVSRHFSGAKPLSLKTLAYVRELVATEHTSAADEALLALCDIERGVKAGALV